MYTVTLDDSSKSTKDGQNTEGLYQQNMFAATGLPFGRHSVTLENTNRTPAAPYVDLDYIIITVGDGNLR